MKTKEISPNNNAVYQSKYAIAGNKLRQWAAEVSSKGASRTLTIFHISSQEAFKKDES
jgi:hypothetical protein